MSWQTNPAIIGLRNVARKTGAIQFINQFLPRKKNYEQAFDTAMFEAIKPGDVIWDVGANVGYYSRKFSDSVCLAGQVFAFEPFPATAARLRAELTGVETVTVLPVALGAETGTVSMRQGDDEFGATSRIVAQGGFYRGAFRYSGRARPVRRPGQDRAAALGKRLQKPLARSLASCGLPFVDSDNVIIGNW